jgi:hypothetical protein
MKPSFSTLTGFSSNPKPQKRYFSSTEIIPGKKRKEVKNMAEKEKKQPNPLVAAAVGAAVGAGVATAAAVMRDKKTQRKIKQSVGKASEQAQKFADTVKEKAAEQKNKIQEKVTTDGPQRKMMAGKKNQEG